MPLLIAQCTTNDIPSIVDIYFAAFQNPLALAAFPDIHSVREWWIDMLSDEIKHPDALFLKVVDYADNSKEGQIIAWGKWNRPGISTESKSELPTWPDGGDHKLSSAFFGQLAQKHAAIMKNPHWYLELIATFPPHQGRGAGSMLLSHVLHQADQEGFEAYLEASPESVYLYQKFDFKEVDRIYVTIDGKPYYNLCMIRKPIMLGR